MWLGALLAMLHDRPQQHDHPISLFDTLKWEVGSDGRANMQASQLFVLNDRGTAGTDLVLKQKGSVSINGTHDLMLLHSPQTALGAKVQ